MSEPQSATSTTSIDVDEITQSLSIPSSKPIQVTSYLNDRYPTQQSLTTALPTLDTHLSSAESRLHNHLTSIITHHRHDTKTASSAIDATTATSNHLKSTLTALTSAAQTAHSNVATALAPAVPVYTALTNVIHTLQALDSLISLDDAVHKLEKSARTADLESLARDSSPFQIVSTSISTLDSLTSSSPKKSMQIKGLDRLRSRASVANESIRAITLNAFKLHSDAVSNMDAASTETHQLAVRILSSACTVAQSMGNDVRAEVVGAFVRRRRASLRAAFTNEQGLTSTDKKFSWVRKELRTHWAHLGGERVDRGWGKVFPKDWSVDRKIADGLIAECRDSVSIALDLGGGERDVDLMILALGKSKEFEIELDRRFGIIATTSTVNHDVKSSSFVGAISDCFGPWMGAFVIHEDEHLNAGLSELVRDETWKTGDDEYDNSTNSKTPSSITSSSAVLKSATELFLSIKKSMRTCATLDTRQPLFSLHRVFRKHLTTYASVLVRNLPGIRGNSLADSSTQPSDFDDKLRKACLIVNTAYYCSVTTEQLEENLRKIVTSVFKDDIDMNSERERFNMVCVKGIQSIVALVEEDVEIDLKIISNKDWLSSISNVGDASPYTEKVSIKLSSLVKKAHERLSRPQHFRFLVEKIAAAVIGRVHQHVYECDQISNITAQQILLDIITLKGLLVGLPASVNAATATTFVKFVNREMGRVEGVLKVILAPLKSCVDTYVTLISDTGGADDFQKVLEIGGLKRAEAAPLVLEYSRRIGPSQRLKPPSRDGHHEHDERNRNLKTNLSNQFQQQQQGAGLVPVDAAEAAGAAVDSVKNLLGRFGSSLIETGASQFGQVSSQLESTTDRLKKEAASASARWPFFGK